MNNKYQNVKELIHGLAGSPSELKKQLKKINCRYVVVQRGGVKKYIVRGKGISRIVVKL